MPVELTEASGETVVSGNCVSEERNWKEAVVFLFLEMECWLEEGCSMAAIVREQRLHSPILCVVLCCVSILRWARLRERGGGSLKRE